MEIEQLRKLIGAMVDHHDTMKENDILVYQRHAEKNLETLIKASFHLAPPSSDNSVGTQTESDSDEDACVNGLLALRHDETLQKKKKRAPKKATPPSKPAPATKQKKLTPKKIPKRKLSGRKKAAPCCVCGRPAKTACQGNMCRRCCIKVGGCEAHPLHLPTSPSKGRLVVRSSGDTPEGRCNRCECPLYRDEIAVRCRSCSQLVHSDCTKLRTAFPVLGDSCYSFTCSQCAPGSRVQFTMLSRSWTQIGRLALFNLPKDAKHTFRDILGYISENDASLSPGGIDPSIVRPSLRKALDAHPSVFERGEGGGSWSLRPEAQLVPHPPASWLGKEAPIREMRIAPPQPQVAMEQPPPHFTMISSSTPERIHLKTGVAASPPAGPRKLVLPEGQLSREKRLHSPTSEPLQQQPQEKKRRLEGE